MYIASAFKALESMVVMIVVFLHQQIDVFEECQKKSGVFANWSGILGLNGHSFFASFIL